MKHWPLTLVLGFSLLALPVTASAENEGADLRILNAKRIFNSINESNQPIPKEVLQDANVIVIFHKLGKGGFLYAGKFGLGVVMVRNPETKQWSAPAFMRMSGGSFGFQAGAQFSDVVLVGKGNYTFEKFKGGPAVSAAMSATAGWWGVHSEAGSGWESPRKMHWYSRNRGLFGSLSLDGNVMSYDQGATSAYYGQGVIAQDVLFGKEVRPSPTGQMLIEDISKYEGNTPGKFGMIGQMMPKISFAEPTEAQKQKAQIQVPSWMPRFGKK
jgi:lipid-binding SYLF domain-containing protein